MMRAKPNTSVDYGRIDCEPIHLVCEGGWPKHGALEPRPVDRWAKAVGDHFYHEAGDDHLLHDDSLEN